MVYTALAAHLDGGWELQPGDAAGRPLGPPRRCPLITDLAAVEHRDQPRWVFNDVLAEYPALLREGLTLGRCHDVTLTERILLGRAGRHGEPAAAAAVLARSAGQPAAPDPGPTAVADPGLFDAPAADRRPLGAPEVLQALQDQLGRVDAAAGAPPGQQTDVDPAALRLLIAAESASALVAAEMGLLGLPWDTDEHRRILQAALGPRSVGGERPAALAELARQIQAAFGFPVNPDSATDLRAAFRRAGFDVESTRSWVLQQLDHPAVRPVLAYKELSRLHTANGWKWLETWVRDGRFRADYLPGGVVSGRWATRGGGALQIPKAMRSAVVADPGWRLVVADAAQLEPRVLIAVSGDRRLGELASAADLYTALASVGFSGDRGKAKLAMLGAMYGQTSGAAGQLLGALRSHFPAAMEYVAEAARRGERGQLVRSVLGRSSHYPGSWWQDAVGAGSAPAATPAQDRAARSAARSWGRFTRNFVIQASAADWAAVWLSALRRELRAGFPDAELVFFQHDELIVHAPQQQAADVADVVVRCAAEADRLVFPAAPDGWLVPVRPVVAIRYSDAK